MDETILLKNGVLIQNAHCLEYNERLFVYINSTDDMAFYFELFIEPNNLTVIKENRYGEKKVYEGYTDLYSISKENGNINLVLQRG